MSLDINLSFEQVEKEISESTNRPETGKNKKNLSIEYEIIEVLGKLSDGKNPPILAIVKWGDLIRYDLRKWNDDMTKPFKGISFEEKEIDSILSLSNFTIDDSVEYIARYSGEKANASIYKNLSILSEDGKDGGWKKEVNVVDWGYGKKIDFRKWANNYTKCGKGISITAAEFENMLAILNKKRNGING